MSRLLKKISKLTIDELRVRGSQTLNSFAERRGWSSLSKLPDDDVLRSLLVVKDFADDPLKYFRARKQPVFFLGLDDSNRTVAALRERWSDAESEVIQTANRIVDGRFDLLGYVDLQFGDPIDWQLEPLSGKSASLVHWSSLDYLNAESVGDKKIIWELNRHQYFVTLGQAYWLTKDEKYAIAFDAHLSW